MKNVEATTTEAATVTGQGTPDAPKTAPSKEGASQNVASRGAKNALGGTATAASKKEGKARRPARTEKGTKEERSNNKAEVIALMKRAKGATLGEIVKR